MSSAVPAVGSCAITLSVASSVASALNSPTGDGSDARSPAMLTRNQRLIVLLVAFIGLLCAGNQLGLNPIFSIPAAESFFGTRYTDGIGGQWTSYFTAATMFGAAIGGIVFGSLGDRFGRSRMLGVCIIVCASIGAIGALAQTPVQLMLTRFLVGLGVGGVWPNGVALVAECWSGISRATASAIMGTAINVGIFIISQLCGHFQVTSQSWRWILAWCGLPTVAGLYALLLLPESIVWTQSKRNAQVSIPSGSTPNEVRIPSPKLFGPALIRTTIIGILLGGIPLIGAWAAGKWIVPWAAKVAGKANTGYKATVQGYWSFGAIVGSFLGSYMAVALGRKRAYFLISVLSLAVTGSIFLWLTPFHPLFLKMVFVQGLVSTLYFGWLPLCLPEMFPLPVRAAGAGIAYNTGRFAAAAGILFGGVLLGWSNGDYARVGLLFSLIYVAGMIVIFFAPERSTMS